MVSLWFASLHCADSHVVVPIIPWVFRVASHSCFRLGSPNELVTHRGGAGLTFSGISGWLIGATVTLFSAVRSLKHSPVALLITEAADSYRHVMTVDT